MILFATTAPDKLLAHAVFMTHLSNILFPIRCIHGLCRKDISVHFIVNCEPKVKRSIKKDMTKSQRTNTRLPLIVSIADIVQDRLVS